MSGKTTLARALSRHVLAAGQKSIVYDPTGTATAGGDWGEGARVFDDLGEFLAYIESDDAIHAHVFVDEADIVFGHDSPENQWLLRRGRHWGLFVYCITQRPKLVPPNVRSMCGRAYVFRLTQNDMREVAADYGFDDAHRISLDKGDFLCFTAGSSEYKRGNVFQMLNVQP